MTQVGTKRILWKEDFRLEAYQDQLGKWHKAYVVLAEFIVTIIEEKPVPYVWAKGMGMGWLAVTEDRREFTCNWHNFPDDAMTPTYYWDVVRERNGDLWVPVDALQAANFNAYVTEHGTKALPTGAQKCEKHNYIYLPEEGCYRCEYENEKRDK